MSVKVVGTTRSPRVIETIFARVEAVDATWDEVVDVALMALGETRSSLYGYGIEGVVSGTPMRLTGTLKVYAHRD